MALVLGREVRCHRDDHPGRQRRVVGGRDDRAVVVDADAVAVPQPGVQPVRARDRVDRPRHVAGTRAGAQVLLGAPGGLGRGGRDAQRLGLRLAERHGAADLDPVAARPDDLDVDRHEVAVAEATALRPAQEVRLGAHEDERVARAAREHGLPDRRADLGVRGARAQGLAGRDEPGVGDGDGPHDLREVLVLLDELQARDERAGVHELRLRQGPAQRVELADREQVGPWRSPPMPMRPSPSPSSTITAAAPPGRSSAPDRRSPWPPIRISGASGRRRAYQRSAGVGTTSTGPRPDRVSTA